MTNDERAQIRAEAVRDAQTAVRNAMVAQEWPPQDGDKQIDEVLAALTALLPKPDPATDLINDWLSTAGIEPERDAAAMMLTFARWAVDTGRLKG